AAAAAVPGVPAIELMSHLLADNADKTIAVVIAAAISCRATGRFVGAADDTQTASYPDGAACDIARINVADVVRIKITIKIQHVGVLTHPLLYCCAIVGVSAGVEEYHIFTGCDKLQAQVGIALE